MSYPSKSEFKQALREALACLYDPARLTASPLIEWFGLRGDSDPGGALLSILLQAIESRHPGPDAPPQSNAWRVYHILRQRYVECFGQHDIAANLSLGTRQLRRLHVLAIDVLGDYLLARYQTAHQPPASAPVASHAKSAAPDDQEMGLLGATPTEPARPCDLVEDALILLAPLVQGGAVSVQNAVTVQLPPVAVQRVPVHHAFLSILKTALRAVAGGQLAIQAEASSERVWLHLAMQPAPASGPALQLDEEQVATARRLLRLSNGDLTIRQGQGGGAVATITLCTVAAVPVVVVDDNVDALQLFQRYLDGTRYRFIGAADPQHVVDLAEEMAARLVVLDLMLPRVDGWEILSRLREHPRTSHIPVIICTILPEEDLALMFGAVGLLRKPVSQPELLAALDRALALPRESH